MKGIVEERAVELGEYIIAHKATVRAAAKEFGISKSTVHMDVSERLRRVNPQLYQEVREVLDVNKLSAISGEGSPRQKKYRAMQSIDVIK